MLHRRTPLALATSLLVASLLAGCGGPPAVARGTVSIVAAENEYGSVAAQVGGRYVTVRSIESNPNTDPHDYEITPGVTAELSSAAIVIQNGVGYDAWIIPIEQATPSSHRRVIVAQDLLGWPASTPNPHLWYDPATMPLVASALVTDLSKLQPAHAAYFRSNEASFLKGLAAWRAQIAAFASENRGTSVATTEPVADYLLDAMGLHNLTPWSLQADVMNSVDPTAQDVAAEASLFAQHKVKVLVYNQQVTDALTASFIADAKANHIPVVAVYETMPTPGFTYQSWMRAELGALTRAIRDGVSTARL